MKRWNSLVAATAVFAIGGAAIAQGAFDARLQEDQSNYVWARVLTVEPILARQSSPEAREVCWDQPVSYYQPGQSYPTHRRDPQTGAIVGALIGGALGTQIGSGRGRTAATVAGAAAGGKIGHDLAGGCDQGHVREAGTEVQGYERVCETRTTERVEDRIIGYDVRYELEGEVFNARTDAHPGDQIRVAVIPYS